MAGIIEVTASQYQSVFQLAAALNFGLSIFRQLRQPAQEQLLKHATNLHEAAQNFSQIAVSRMRALESTAEEKSIASGLSSNPDVDFVRNLDHEAHAKATDVMLRSITIEEDASAYVGEVYENINNWERSDRSIEFIAILFFFLSLFCLGYTTVSGNHKFVDDAATATTMALSILAVSCYLPILLSFAMALWARFHLFGLQKAIRNCSRQLLKLHRPM